MRKIVSISFLCLTLLTAKSQLNHNMHLLGALNEHSGYYSSCYKYKAMNGKRYALLGCYEGTAIINISDSNNIHEVDFIPGLPNGWREMKTYSHYLYIVSEAENSGLQIIDLSTLPDSASLVNTFYFSGFNRAHTISQAGTHLFINGGNYRNGGIAVLDISNPVNPVKRGEWENDYVHDCRIVNNIIWACNPLTGFVTAVNCSNKDNLTTTASFHNVPYPVPHNCDLTNDGKYIFVTDENWQFPGKVKIWNIENLSNIFFAAEWSISGTSYTVHNVEIFGQTALVSYYGEGIRILDIRNPLNPVQTAWYATPGCWAAHLFEPDIVIASDITSGLYVLRIEDVIGILTVTTETPNQFSLSQNYPNPFNPATKIKFQIPTVAQTFLSVHDLLGREVTTLVNEQLTPGTYEADWSADNFSSGVYYYKLIAGDYTETKKMVLIK